MTTDLEIHYQPTCRDCGESVDEPFVDDLCLECDHSQHWLAPWEAPDCELCWPFGYDDFFDNDEDDYEEELAEHYRLVVDAPIGGEVL